MYINEKIRALGEEVEKEFSSYLSDVDEIARFNQEKVLDAFIKNRVGENCLYPSTGYGYGDVGRETLDSIYADIFGAEDALVRHNIVNGTHCLAISLFPFCAPGILSLLQRENRTIPSKRL